MTPEQKRERLLKRILPGMAITVIYFVFVSGVLSEKMHKAEEVYQNLYRQGISPAAVPGLLNQVSQAQRQISELQRQKAELGDTLQKVAGFLSGEGSPNEAGALLATIMTQHGIGVVEEKRDRFAETDLNASLQEVLRWLKPAAPANAPPARAPGNSATIAVERLVLRGAYLDMYHAMAALADSDLKGAPVQLTMKMPEEADGLKSGELAWELILWM